MKQTSEDKSGRKVEPIGSGASSASAADIEADPQVTLNARESLKTPEPPREEDPDIADGVLHQVDRGYVKTEAINWWIVTAVNFIAGGIPLTILSILHVGPTWLRLLLIGVWGALVMLLSFLSLRYPVWEFERTRFRVTPGGIEIWKGVVWRQVFNVPRNRVQHTDVSQGPILRHYGLATLTIHTAGTANSIVTLHGVTKATALRLRDFLIRREPARDD